MQTSLAMIGFLSIKLTVDVRFPLLRATVIQWLGSQLAAPHPLRPEGVYISPMVTFIVTYLGSPAC
jgi:hypothetical protein